MAKGDGAAGHNIDRASYRSSGATDSGAMAPHLAKAGAAPAPSEACVPHENPCGCCAGCQRRASLRVLGEALREPGSGTTPDSGPTTPDAPDHSATDPDTTDTPVDAAWTFEETLTVLRALGLKMSPRQRHIDTSADTLTATDGAADTATGGTHGN